MKKQLLLVALLYSQLFAAQILVNLDLSDKKIIEQNLEIPQINHDRSINTIYDIWQTVNQFLRSVGANKNDHYDYNNIANELLNLKITSVDFDYKTLTQNSINYKINYEINYNYDNYQYHAKKLINSLSKLAKPQIKSLSESEFLSFLNNQKTQDKQFLNDEYLSLIYVLLKNKDNYDMYIYTILGKKTLGLNDGFYKNMALAPDYVDYISMGAFLGLKEYSVNEPSYQYQEDYFPSNSEYFFK